MEENGELIEKADLVLVERFHVGPGNLDNLRAAWRLWKREKVIVLENNLEYDLPGGSKDYYRRLKEKGAVFILDHSRPLEEAEKQLNHN
jgi:hypothetical protein